MLLIKKEEIKNWLNKYAIRNYEIIEDKVYGYVVNVNGNVNLIKKEIKKIEVKFNEINGDFYCDDNELTSLEGCPEIINGNFDCGINKLVSLKNGPKIISGCLFSYSNKLEIEGLKYLPNEIEKNFIKIYDNENLGDLENITDFKELKEKVNIILEKDKLFNIINKNKSINKI